MTDSTPATAAGIPYEDTDCTADEAVEAVEAVRATAADCRECGVEADACCADLGYPCCWFCTVTRVAHMLRDWPCTNPAHDGLCSDDHVHADHVVTGIHKDPTTGGSA